MFQNTYRTKSIDGESGGKSGEHSNRRQGDTIEVSGVEGDIDNDGQTEDREDNRLVAERESVDDVRGSSSCALSHSKSM